MIRPGVKMVRRWRDGIDRNDTSGNLASMSMWLSNAVTIVDQGETTREAAHRYALIFKGIADIHEAYGSIPKELYDFRYKIMSEWLEWVRQIDQEVWRVFNSCL